MKVSDEVRLMEVPIHFNEHLEKSKWQMLMRDENAWARNRLEKARERSWSHRRQGHAEVDYGKCQPEQIEMR